MSDGDSHGQRRDLLEQLIRDMPEEAVDILQRLGPDALRQLERRLTVDALTGLANPRAFQRCLWQARKSGAGGALALLDLDRFKLVNDALGHQAGDEVLIQFARRLRAHLPGTCVVGRLGSDEFAIFFPGTGTEEASGMLGQLRASLDQAPLTVGGIPVGQSFSAGVVRFQDFTPDQAIQAADMATYAAKARGRGRVEVFTDQVSEVIVRRRELAASIVEFQRRIEELETAVRTDTLTGLHNLRALERILDTPITRHAGQEGDVAVAFIDIDHFGDYNHQHGDHRGDAALRSVALALRESLREGDLLFRKGGEEFVAVLSTPVPEAAEAWGERMRGQVEALGIPHSASSTAACLTVTVGVATGGVGGTWRELMYAAGEQAMAAKRLRMRNRVHLTHVAPR